MKKMQFLGTFCKHELRLEDYIHKHIFTNGGNDVILCFSKQQPYTLQRIAFCSNVQGDYAEIYEEFQIQLKVENGRYIDENFTCDNMDKITQWSISFVDAMLSYKKSLLYRISNPTLEEERIFVRTLPPSTFIKPDDIHPNDNVELEKLDSYILKIEQKFHGVPEDIYKIVVGNKILCTLNNESVARQIFSYIVKDIKSVLLAHWAFLGQMGETKK